MKLLMLRGHVPQDRSPDEIKYRKIDEVDDIYELLAYYLGDEGCEILYEGGSRDVSYSDKCACRWVPSMKKHELPWKPDVIFIRGAFDFYKPMLKRYPDATKIYYGAGKNWLPENAGHYKIVLVDSLRQKELAAAKNVFNTLIWKKPVAPMFKYQERDRMYDLCFVAAIPDDARKNVKWVYETCPSYYKVLQLGFQPKNFIIPPNFKIRHLLRSDMPRAMNKCRLGIVPYTKDDSGPRAMVEMMACGLDVVCLKSVQHCMPIKSYDEDLFWQIADRKLHSFDESVSKTRSEMIGFQNSPQTIASFMRDAIWA